MSRQIRTCCYRRESGRARDEVQHTCRLEIYIYIYIHIYTILPEQKYCIL